MTDTALRTAAADAELVDRLCRPRAHEGQAVDAWWPNYEHGVACLEDLPGVRDRVLTGPVTTA